MLRTIAHTLQIIRNHGLRAEYAQHLGLGGTILITCPAGTEEHLSVANGLVRIDALRRVLGY
jgi:hypothetical protein